MPATGAGHEVESKGFDLLLRAANEREKTVSASDGGGSTSTSTTSLPRGRPTSGVFRLSPATSDTGMHASTVVSRTSSPLKHVITFESDDEDTGPPNRRRSEYPTPNSRLSAAEGPPPTQTSAITYEDTIAQARAELEYAALVAQYTWYIALLRERITAVLEHLVAMSDEDAVRAELAAENLRHLRWRMEDVVLGRAPSHPTVVAPDLHSEPPSSSVLDAATALSLLSVVPFEQSPSPDSRTDIDPSSLAQTRQNPF